MFEKNKQMNFRQLFEQKKGQEKQVLLSLNSNLKKLEDLKSEKQDLEAAQAIIQLVAQATQEELKYHISEIVTLALSAVFDDPLEFEVDFVQKRNQIEADLWFVKEGERLSPMTAHGGGYVNVSAFALRVALLSLKKPRLRPILLLDEAFANVKGEEANIRAIQMVKEVSKQMGLQVICISDERVPMKDIEEGADKVHTIKIKKEVSYVE